MIDVCELGHDITFELPNNLEGPALSYREYVALEDDLARVGLLYTPKHLSIYEQYTSQLRVGDMVRLDLIEGPRATDEDYLARDFRNEGLLARVSAITYGWDSGGCPLVTFEKIQQPDGRRWSPTTKKPYTPRSKQSAAYGTLPYLFLTKMEWRCKR